MCRLYSARKKLIHAMSLDIDRPINRAAVVGCPISATRNYLKLHISRTLKVLLCNTHAETRKLWKRSAGLPPLEAIPVDQVMFARRLDLAKGDVCGGLLIQINGR